MYIRVTSGFLFLSFAIASAQAPPTIDEALKERHVSASPEGLKRALHNNDPIIRGMAAMAIAEKGEHDQIPALRMALSVEADDNARLNISRALSIFGDPSGKAGLESVCADARVPGDLRILAVDELAPDVPRKCFSALVQILSESSNPALSQAALLSLQRTTPEKIASDQDRESLSIALSRALSSTVPSVRQAAAKDIVIYKATLARNALATAAEEEQDPPTRLVMKQSLEALPR